MAKSNLPFSVLTKLNDLESGQDGDGKKMLTKEEFKKTKELEEARKAGTAPAQVDEEGKDINPHIPSYISVTPWYFGSTGPTLKHQRPQEEKAKFFNSIKDHYVRGLQGPKANKYRKGACENCGAMGHKKKECFERPRKVGAKYKSEKICPDDVVLPDLAMDYDGKRDRWNGFNPVDYTAVIDEHQKLEDYKHQLKAQKLRDGEEINEDEPDDDDDEDDEKYADHIDMPGTKVDGKQRITVRNLRIREDTAKYLRNLDPNSAYYDPKSRSMRENPYIGTGKKSDEVDFAGENFVRFSGDTINHAKTQLFAWEAYEKGVDVSLLAEPTKLELLKKEFIKKKEEYKGQVSGDLLEKYGGKEHLDVPPPELLLAQTENYVEYSRLGKVIKGTEVQIVLSKYEEDIFPNNHMSVWGSYWRDGNWGYKCCHSFIKNSYCTGEAGRTTDLPVAVEVAPEPVEVEEEKTLLEMHTDKMETKKKKKSKRKKKALKKESSSSSSDSSSDESDEEQKEEKRKKKLREALIRAKLEEEQGTAEAGMDDRERKYNTKYENKTLTEEDIEAYQIRRVRDDDPMAAFMNKS